jgi:hypothetical protein
MAVPKAIHELNEEVPSKALSELACVGNEVEELSTLCQFQNNIADHKSF